MEKSNRREFALTLIGFSAVTLVPFGFPKKAEAQACPWYLKFLFRSPTLACRCSDPCDCSGCTCSTCTCDCVPNCTCECLSNEASNSAGNTSGNSQTSWNRNQSGSTARNHANNDDECMIAGYDLMQTFGYDYIYPYQTIYAEGEPCIS